MSCRLWNLCVCVCVCVLFFQHLWIFLIYQMYRLSTRPSFTKIPSLASKFNANYLWCIRCNPKNPSGSKIFCNISWLNITWFLFVFCLWSQQYWPIMFEWALVALLANSPCKDLASQVANRILNNDWHREEEISPGYMLSRLPMDTLEAPKHCSWLPEITVRC